ncbi:MAG: InlB B-repeat-containing protein, partial [Prevotella sp.]|nr:InlB B-repeat-containing protein [Prevotella sp.]
MLSLFLLVGVILSVQASGSKTFWKATATTAVTAETNYVESSLLTVSTVYAGTLASYSHTYTSDSEEFAKSIQVRVDAVPSTTNVTGTEKSGSTPLVFAVGDEDVYVVMYYRRQADNTSTSGNRTYTENNGKDIKIVDQSAPTTLLTGTFTTEGTANDDYAYCKKGVTLEANHTYTVWASGTTVQFNGFSYATMHTITASAGSNGSVSGGGVFAYGETATLTATADPGYVFTNWTKSSDSSTSTSNPLEVTVEDDETYTASFEESSNFYTVTYSLGSATDVAGTVPSAEQASYVTIPTNTSLYKFGYTLTGWNDGTATYAAGDIYTPTADVILTAVFTENTEGLDEFKKDKTVTWYFGKSNGAPDYDGSVTATVQQVKVKNTTVDLGIAMAGGSNEGRTDEWMNNQQKDMMVPVSPGAVVTAKVYYQNNASFNGETITYDEQYGTTGNVVYSYTYTGEEPTSIAVNVGNQFLSYISVTYPGTSVPGANFEDFSAIVNNQTGTLLTQEELVQGTAVSFGIGSGSTRVAANDEDAIAVISGTYHNDHGCTGLNVVVPVPGAVKIGVGQCTYSTSKINVKDGNNTTVISITPAASCWKNDHTKVTYMYYTGDPTTLTINGMSYCPFVSVAAVDLYTLTGSISGGDINGADVVLTSNLTGQEFIATVADGAFTLDVPADTYSISLENAVGYVLSTPTAVTVTAAAALNLTVAAAAEQTVTGAITNAPAEAFALTFTATNDNTHTTVVNCAANATSFEAELMPDTYTISSSAGTLSTLSQESFQVISSAVTFNIYYPETVPAATQQNITVDNTLATATANNYKSVSDALAAAKAGSVSSPVITLTSGQTYREQVIVDMANVTLKTSGTEKAKITFYYGIGYSYYSLNSSGYYDKDRAMTRNSMLTRNP